MHLSKEDLAIEIMNLSKGARIENDTHSLEVTGDKDHSMGHLFYAKIIEKTTKKCLFSGPILPRAPKRERFTLNRKQS